ncbi:hypothetical protein IGI04_008186 [Brassica rapa subsp. trilocularis]|uniref:Uncharacterized protein n=1 Tax=Brassica rapa subsp. trilocularis TaxID=1813537 RepID=A0ABQ7NLV9_BRACM|nr:hypothetical protein IGI04_008186 [Brassica rapa subsp. trilocularis]
MNGEQTEETFQVQANFATGTRWVLLDTGSTHNFMKSSLVEDLGIPIHRKSRWFVALPDGGKCPIQGFCQGMVMSVQGHQFKAGCFAIPLKGFYVVLGIRWLNALGRVIWDGLNKTIEFHHSSTPVVWHGESKARGKPQVSLHALECDGEALDNWFSDEEEVFTTPRLGDRLISVYNCSKRVRSYILTTEVSQFVRPIWLMHGDFAFLTIALTATTVLFISTFYV